jgi:hypothetical protein
VITDQKDLPEQEEQAAEEMLELQEDKDKLVPMD